MPITMAARMHQNRHTGSTKAVLLVGIIVALLAIANLMVLTNWHASLTGHDDLTADSTALGYGHHHHDEADHADEDHAAAGSGLADQETPAVDLHALSHAMIHGLAALVPGITVAVPPHETANDWFAGRSFALSGISPEALLRPPRS
ncbi:hypothetical protein A8V01_15175 [Novosphingobium guangzhouense]|uniref:Uncharacterized protein n=2 Tax=Novosphingobium guangzhouense TaxID=1850347 RepID=A0A2K2G3R7_9SPHN|nr:hypothetical protein A8V01_15175 [Novosphingobium guangzhouense]